MQNPACRVPGRVAYACARRARRVHVVTLGSLLQVVGSYCTVELALQCCCLDCQVEAQQRAARPIAKETKWVPRMRGR